MADAKRNSTEFSDFKPYKMAENEEYMNDKQRAHFKQLLVNWKHMLLNEMNKTVNHLQDELSQFPDPNDRATQESEFGLELRTREREGKLIKKIEKTITEINGDDYGYCQACGIEIGLRRLEARPTATLCIDCKTLEEIREKQLRQH